MADIIRPVYNEIWASSGEFFSPGSAKISSGWVQELMPYQYENFLQNRNDTSIAYLLQKGVPEWDSGQEYIANKSIVSYSSNLYISLVNSTGVVPTDTVTWRRLTVTIAPDGTIPIASGGTGAATATDARTNLGLGTAATISADSIVFKSVTGNAPAADKWTSPIILSLSGGATGNTSLDGSGNATINVSGLNASSISSGTVPSTALSNATLKTSPTGSTVLASGLTSERDLSPSEGYTRWNKTTKVVEVFNGTSWTVNTSQSEAYLLNRANHTGEQTISTVTGLQTALDAKAANSSVAQAIAMAGTFTTVPTTFQAWNIIVTQPHLRVMVWNGARYVRAPWHAPGKLSYFLRAVPDGHIEVRSDVVLNKADFPDLAEYLGVSAATFVLDEARGEFLRSLDSGRGKDAGRVVGSHQGDAGRNLTGYVGTTLAWHGASGVGGSLALVNPAPGVNFGVNGQNGAYFSQQNIELDASRQWPVANEFRVTNRAYRLAVTY